MRESGVEGLPHIIFNRDELWAVDQARLEAHEVTEAQVFELMASTSPPGETLARKAARPSDAVLEHLARFATLSCPVVGGHLIAEVAGRSYALGSEVASLALMRRQNFKPPEPIEVAPSDEVADSKVEDHVGAVASSPDSESTRVPVYAIWHPEIGPQLSLGMLTAAARHHDGGSLNDYFEIRKPETADSFLADLAGRSGPAVLLCSDYIFTIEHNLRAARAGIELNPQLLIIHGGPSSPKYPGDAAEFLESNAEVAHILVRGEGEVTLSHLLGVLADDQMSIDTEHLAEIPGLTFADDSSLGGIVRTPDRERVAELDDLPSPYLTGEFDEIPLSGWTQPPFFETNRGCPYGCTFCDWGSATKSRIRKFSIARTRGEFEWAAKRGFRTWFLCDANFGILPRDVEIAEIICHLHNRFGAPSSVSLSPAKNVTKHLAKIFEIMNGCGIAVHLSISLQSTDPDVLMKAGRHNISTEAYLKLAADLRQRGHALVGDLIVGLAGQTYDSYKRDVQFMLDHEIMPRTFRLRLLPNSPMNSPEYREMHGIKADSFNVVTSTATLTPSENQRCMNLRRAETIFERYGVLRHIMRYLQWDEGILASDVMNEVVEMALGQSSRYPEIAWLYQNFDVFPTPLSGWDSFYAEMTGMILERFGVKESSGFRTALEIQKFLMPQIGRDFPATLELQHDYVSYYQSARAELYASGHAGTPQRRLADYGPASFTVRGDPLELCTRGLHFPGDSGNQMIEGDFQVGTLVANELDSDLLRILPAVLLMKDAFALQSV